LLDEPSAGVSPGIAVEIYQRIKEQICGTDTAVLVVEQNLQFLPDFATRIIVMRNGEIFKNDLPLEQLKNTETIFNTFYGE
jgi:ABC-type branched-subunit amino acid transport system ATPase component